MGSQGRSALRASASTLLPLAICALAMEASFLSLHAARSASEQILLVLMCHLAGGLAFVWVLWAARTPEGRSLPGWTTGAIILAALVFRLTLIPLVPATSPDVYRYLWEGMVQSQGFDPYVFAPSAPQLGPLARQHADLWEEVTFRNIPTIYPPTAQLLFRANALLFDGSLLGWKFILLLCDALLAAGIWALLRRRRRPAVWLVGVLWCPLLLLETYEAGHLDVVGVALLVMAFVTLERKHPIVAGVLLGLAFNVKYLWPALAALLFIGLAWRQRKGLVFAGVVIITAGTCWIPYRGGLKAALDTARMFTESWTFNDVTFEWLRMLPGPPWVPMVLVLIVLTVLVAVLARGVSDNTWSDTWLISGTALLLSPVAYSWYFVWIVPGLALAPPLWLVVWVLSVPALHVAAWQEAITGIWDPMPRLWYVVGAGPAVLLLRGWWQRLRGGHAREGSMAADA